MVTIQRTPVDQAAVQKRRRRLSRRMKLILAGLAAVAIGVGLTSILALAYLEKPTKILVTSAPLYSGQVIQSSDVTTIPMRSDSMTGFLTEDDLGAVVGQTAALALASGLPLTADVIGAPLFPKSGYTETTIAVNDGRWPVRMAPGQSVSIFGEAGDGSVWAAEAVVLALSPQENGGARATVELSTADAKELTIIPSESVMIVAVAPPSDTNDSSNGDS